MSSDSTARIPGDSSSSNNLSQRLDVPKELAQLAEKQGVRPITSLDELRADFWPEDESMDDFLATLRLWRHEGREDT